MALEEVTTRVGWSVALSLRSTGFPFALQGRLSVCDNRSSDNKLRGMAKGIRSKVKRANRTEQRRVKVDPMIAKRTKELAEKLEKDINMKRKQKNLNFISEIF